MAFAFGFTTKICNTVQSLGHMSWAYSLTSPSLFSHFIHLPISRLNYYSSTLHLLICTNFLSHHRYVFQLSQIFCPKLWFQFYIISPLSPYNYIQATHIYVTVAIEAISIISVWNDNDLFAALKTLQLHIIQKINTSRMPSLDSTKKLLEGRALILISGRGASKAK